MLVEYHTVSSVARTSYYTISIHNLGGEGNKAPLKTSPIEIESMFKTNVLTPAINLPSQSTNSTERHHPVVVDIIKLTG